MKCDLRQAEPNDFLALAAIHNAQNEPDWHVTAEHMARQDAQFKAKDAEYYRVVALQQSQCIGTASIHARWGEQRIPHHYWIVLSTHRDYRHQGVDDAMIRALLAQVQAGKPEQLWCCIREDFVPMVEFLDSFGFSEAFRSWGAHLDVQAFNVDDYQMTKQSLESAGIRFCPYLELAAESREADLVALQKNIEEDVPYYLPIIPKVHATIRSPTIPEQSCFVALAEGNIVGMASLNTENPRLLQNGLTGVRRDYRNRGIATVLKALVASYAKQQGALDINAAGAGQNQAMRRVNEKLGYAIEPAWITFRALL